MNKSTHLDPPLRANAVKGKKQGGGGGGKRRGKVQKNNRGGQEERLSDRLKVVQLFHCDAQSPFWEMTSSSPHFVQSNAYN